MTDDNTAIVAEVRTYMQRMDGALTTIADALIKIARLEERHIETRDSLARAFSAIEKVEHEQTEQRVVIAEMRGDMKQLQEVRGWIVSGVLAVAGLVGVAVVGLVVVK